MIGVSICGIECRVLGTIGSRHCCWVSGWVRSLIVCRAVSAIRGRGGVHHWT